MASQTIIGDPLGGNVYTAPKPKPFGKPMSAIFGSGRSGREREVASTGQETSPRGGAGQFQFKRKEPPPPIPTETVIGDPFGGAVVPPKKKKWSDMASVFGPGGRPGAGQAYSDPDHRQAEREFKGFGGIF